MERIMELAGDWEGSRVLEMANDSQAVQVPTDPRINIAELTKDDPDPMFVNIEVIRTGVSKTNRRLYDGPVVNQVAGMIPGTLGYLGHPDPNKTSFEFREPQNVFVGSKVEELQGGAIRAIGKAYIFKSSPLREWLPKSIAGGTPLTVSINGVGDVMRDSINNLIHVKTISTLDSIDWANPGTEGVGTAQAINIVKEMKDEGGNNMSEPIIKTPEIIRSITIAEMKAYNEDAINNLIAGVTIAELQSKNPKLYNDIKASGAVESITIKIDGAEKTVKLTEMQSIIDGQNQKVTDLQNQIATAKITEYKNNKLNELVPEQYREKIAKRVAGNTEQEIDASIQSEVAFIKEMMGDNIFDNLPKGNRERKINDDIKASVRAMFGVKEDKK